MNIPDTTQIDVLTLGGPDGFYREWYQPRCLACGWCGEPEAKRPVADADRAKHEKLGCLATSSGEARAS